MTIARRGCTNLPRAPGDRHGLRHRQAETFDLVGGSGGDDQFDVGAHDASSTVYVARSSSGSILLGTWHLAANGTFTSSGADVVVGHGTRTRIVVFDNHRIVVLWLDASSALRARAYNSSGDLAGAPITIETTIASFDLAPIGVTTGVQQPVPQGTSVYYAFRQFAFTTLSANGGWKLWLGSVADSGEVTVGPVASAARATRWRSRARPRTRSSTERIRARRSRSGATPGGSRRGAGESPTPA